MTIEDGIRAIVCVESACTCYWDMLQEPCESVELTPEAVTQLYLEGCCQ